mmetsp:Transcript_17176/g.41345  ORF Transcript_17176/g.41345 Transcript_17176/m.41345 type:complete len:248 (-) Transcript_17176:197-940(-)
MTPPPGEALERRRPLFPMVLMDEEPGNPTRPCIQVLVRAPACAVNAPVVEPKLDVPRGMGAVPNNSASLLMRLGRDTFYFKILTCVVLHPRQSHHSDLLPDLLELSQDVLRAQRVLPIPRPQLHQGVSSRQPVVLGLGAEGVEIRWKGMTFSKDLGPARLGVVQSHHQQVQVDGQRVHDRHLLRQRPHHLRALAHHALVDRHPGPSALKVAVHPNSSPLVQLFIDQLPCPLRLKPQRIASHVDTVLF